MTTLIRLTLPRDYDDRILFLQRLKYWLDDNATGFYFEREDERHLPTLLYIHDEEAATAVKLRFNL